ncbi:MAG TPA: EAL domain-containing protein [Mycobacteriales bacterium]|nr:EAL domain-containing protein [Mycobacteriales bacterium]
MSREPGDARASDGRTDTGGGLPPLPDASWRRILEGAAELVIVGRADTEILWLTPSVTEIAGYPPHMLVGQNGWDLVVEEDLEPVTAFMDEVLAHPGPHGPMEFRLRAAGGGEVWVEQRIMNALDDPALGCLVVYMTDVTARRAMSEQVAAREREYRAVLDSATDGIAVVDADGRIRVANAALADLLRTTPDALVGVASAELVDASHRRELFARAAASEADVRLRVVLRAADGTAVPAAVSVTPYAGGNDGSTLAIIRDLSEQQEHEDALQSAMQADPLTGLANRAALHAAVTAAAADPAEQPLGLLLIDLDDFGRINLAYSEEHGDHVLREVGRRLGHAVGPAGVLARVGGDEFGVLVKSVTSESALLQLARQLQAAVAQPLRAVDATVSVTASVGGAVVGSPSPDLLFRTAGRALARARVDGAGRALVRTDAAPAPAPHDVELEQELRRALAHGEPRLHYDPVVRLLDGTCIGAQARIDWLSPSRGLMSGGALITLAHRMGALDAVVDRVLVGACADAATWELIADRLVVVPVMPRLLLRPSFRGAVDRALHRSRLDPQALVLRLVVGRRDESSGPAVMAALAAVRATGVRVAVDDLGLLGTSLMHGGVPPVDLLGLSSAMVGHVGSDAEQSAAASALAWLGRSRGLTVIADGVDEPDDADLLRRLGIELGTGRLWGQRLWPAEMAARLAPRARRGTRARLTTADLDPVVVARLVELRAQAASATTIASALNRDGLPAPGGRRWHPATVRALLAELQRAD